MITIDTLHTSAHQFEDVCVGDSLGMVDGPGVFPLDNLGTVLGFGTDRFHHYIVVQWADGRQEKIVSLTTVGIGVYHIPTYLIQQDQKRRAAA